MSATVRGAGAGPVAGGATRLLESPWIAPTVIWTSAVLISVFAPDMITGSEHEHLPIAVMTVWLWACVGTAYALMTPTRDTRAGWTVGVAVIWALTVVAAVAAPVMVTGTDPTRIPLAVIVAPPVAAVVTGLFSLRQATRPVTDGSQGALGA